MAFPSHVALNPTVRRGRWGILGSPCEHFPLPHFGDAGFGPAEGNGGGICHRVSPMAADPIRRFPDVYPGSQSNGGAFHCTVCRNVHVKAALVVKAVDVHAQHETTAAYPCANSCQSGVKAAMLPC